MRIFLVLGTLLALVLATPDAYSQKSGRADKADKAAQDMRDDVESRRGKLDDMRSQSDDANDDDSDDLSDDDSDDVSDDSSDDDSDDGIARDDRERNSDRLTGRDNAATRGNETSAEMRARKDEKKAIKDDYKADRKANKGEIEAASGGQVLAADAEASDEQQKKAKKPWWKLWGD